MWYATHESLNLNGLRKGNLAEAFDSCARRKLAGTFKLCHVKPFGVELAIRRLEKSANERLMK